MRDGGRQGCGEGKEKWHKVSIQTPQPQRSAGQHWQSVPHAQSANGVELMFNVLIKNTNQFGIALVYGLLLHTLFLEMTQM
jgi:hypothetical protein